MAVKHLVRLVEELYIPCWEGDVVRDLQFRKTALLGLNWVIELSGRSYRKPEGNQRTDAALHS